MRPFPFHDAVVSPSVALAIKSQDDPQVALSMFPGLSSNTIQAIWIEGRISPGAKISRPVELVGSLNVGSTPTSQVSAIPTGTDIMDTLETNSRFDWLQQRFGKGVSVAQDQLAELLALAGKTPWNMSMMFIGLAVGLYLAVRKANQPDFF